jgi:hypothetical protein
MRVFEFADMSMKFERHTDAETLNFEVRIAYLMTSKTDINIDFI